MLEIAKQVKGCEHAIEENLINLIETNRYIELYKLIETNQTLDKIKLTEKQTVLFKEFIKDLYYSLTECEIDYLNSFFRIVFDIRAMRLYLWQMKLFSETDVNMFLHVKNFKIIL